MAYARSVEPVRALEQQVRMQGTWFGVESVGYCQIQQPSRIPV